MVNDSIVKEMVHEGVLFGHKRSKTHPKMRPHIGGTKNEIELLNPESVEESISRAIAFLKEKKLAGGIFLLVGTKPSAKSQILEFAKEMHFPFVTNRWLGGTVTNFPMIQKRIMYYEDLKEKQAKGGFDKYTKKEQRKFAEQIQKMRGNFEGLTELKKTPEVVFFVDANAHETAIREARKAGVPTVGILDTNDDPTLIDYPIFANDHSVKSVEWVMGRIKEALKH